MSCTVCMQRKSSPSYLDFVYIDFISAVSITEKITFLLTLATAGGISVGFFMYIETSKPRQLGDAAVLQSKVFLPTGERCLQFYYHMYGEHMGSLQVLFSSGDADTKLWEKSQDQGNQWHLARVQLPPAKSTYRVRWHFKRLNVPLGRMAEINAAWVIICLQLSSIFIITPIFPISFPFFSFHFILQELAKDFRLKSVAFNQRPKSSLILKLNLFPFPTLSCFKASH